MRKGTLKWDDLRVFLAVVREGRLQSAGKLLGLDPTTAGRRIAALETALGQRLFERTADGYVPTEAGRELVAPAQAMEAQAAALLGAATGKAEGLSGTVRINAPDGVTNYLLVDACEALVRDNPDLQVQVVAVPRVFSMSQGEADLTITVSPPTTGRLTVRKIADYRLHLYARADLVAAVGPVRTMEDLRGVRGIGYISDMVFDRELDYYSMIGREGEPALSSNSLITQIRWCLSGYGICILPEFIGRRHAELVELLADDIRLTRSFYLVLHQKDARDDRINRMADVVVRWVRDALTP
ncbi:DNA-binding transcriptional LysR family regulator [Amaricoccus macauensis]|uniref:DNA-binding transcriptional LysR family regulator n=1 Tax=Amaricoccus macauensis TaxID=57001 RepID=A0A840SGV8_9RHOB|nr:LysR family transcriptional regulator [Amaricoccus macauensis]MBB5222229.1 DNA-binding transcriptional LysR family regulator [Amaricoccus macauensis]